MKTIDEIYKEWCGCSRLENSVKVVHDSTEAIEFAEYYHKASRWGLLQKYHNWLLHNTDKNECLASIDEFLESN